MHCRQHVMPHSLGMCLLFQRHGDVTAARETANSSQYTATYLRLLCKSQQGTVRTGRGKMWPGDEFLTGGAEGVYSSLCITESYERRAAPSYHDRVEFLVRGVFTHTRWTGNNSRQRGTHREKASPGTLGTAQRRGGGGQRGRVLVEVTPPPFPLSFRCPVRSGRGAEQRGERAGDDQITAGCTARSHVIRYSTPPCPRSLWFTVTSAECANSNSPESDPHK